MKHIVALFHEVTRRGLTIGRAVVTVGRSTFEIVVKVFLRK